MGSRGPRISKNYHEIRERLLCSSCLCEGEEAKIIIIIIIIILSKYVLKVFVWLQNLFMLLEGNRAASKTKDFLPGNLSYVQKAKNRGFRFSWPLLFIVFWLYSLNLSSLDFISLSLIYFVYWQSFAMRINNTQHLVN